MSSPFFSFSFLSLLSPQPSPSPFLFASFQFSLKEHQSSSHFIHFMDIPQIYATAAGGFFLIFILIKFLSRTIRERIALFTFKHLTYSYFLHRHRFLGSWTRSAILVQLIYIALNAFCLGFRAFTLSKAGFRVGNLSWTNMISLFAGPHLSFLADILGFCLGTYRRVHRSAGVMSFALLLFHALVVVV